MIQGKEHSKLRYDNKTARPLNVAIGDGVIVFKDVRKNKFDKRATGIYTIVGFTENHNVILEVDDGTRFTKHADKLLVTYNIISKYVSITIFNFNSFTIQICFLLTDRTKMYFHLLTLLLPGSTVQEQRPHISIYGSKLALGSTISTKDQ